MHGAVFGAPFRHGDSNVARVHRGGVEIDSREAFRINYVWIYDDTLGFWGEVGIEGD